MVSEKIVKLRKELDDSIKDKKSYDKIYKLSIELDELIAEYYSEKLKRRVKV